MNASSESGLWATVISRTSLETLSPVVFAVSETAVIDYSKRSAGLLLAPAPARGDCRGEHYLYNFCGNEPVKSEICRFCQRVREQVQPAQASGKQKELGQDAADSCAQEGLSSVLEDVAGGESHEWINEQESASDAEQLGYSAGPSGIKDRQACESFDQIKHDRSKTAAASQQKSDDEHSEILDGERNWSQRHQGDRDVRAQRYKKTRTHNNRDLPRGVKDPLLRSL